MQNQQIGAIARECGHPVALADHMHMAQHAGCLLDYMFKRREMPLTAGGEIHERQALRLEACLEREVIDGHHAVLS
jgi:hypothetical protein